MCCEDDATEPVGLLVGSEGRLRVNAEMWKSQQEQQRSPGDADIDRPWKRQLQKNDMSS
jgi:hypothetical protein